MPNPFQAMIDASSTARANEVSQIDDPVVLNASAAEIDHVLKNHWRGWSQLKSAIDNLLRQPTDESAQTALRYETDRYDLHVKHANEFLAVLSDQLL